MATGVDVLKALDALAYLKGASGRLELVGTHPSGAQVYVDYAHTPDRARQCIEGAPPAREEPAHRRLRRRRRSRRRQAPADGAGGGIADRIIVTDDNPRNESPAAIRRAVIGGAPNADEIADRRAAIRTGVSALKEGATFF